MKRYFGFPHNPGTSGAEQIDLSDDILAAMRKAPKALYPFGPDDTLSIYDRKNGNLIARRPVLSARWIVTL